MELYTVYKHERHPALQLLFLGLMAIFGLLLFAIAGFAIAYLCYGKSILGAVLGQNLSTPAGIGAFRILLTAQQLGLFAVPALLLAVTEQRKPRQFYPMGRPFLKGLIVVFFILLFALPFIGYVNELNQHMRFPVALKSLETWMRNMEDQNMRATKALLSTAFIGGLLANILAVALVPAICEELLFRGAIQRTLARWVKNPHVAIWVAAAVFSTIHFQFYGFFTRLLLGAGLGYIYYLTGSIWYAVFAHFLNNANAVILAFFYAKQQLPIEKADEVNVGWMGALTSIILTLVLFRVLYNMKIQKRPQLNHQQP